MLIGGAEIDAHWDGEVRIEGVLSATNSPRDDRTGHLFRNVAHFHDAGSNAELRELASVTSEIATVVKGDSPIVVDSVEPHGVTGERRKRRIGMGKTSVNVP